MTLELANLDSVAGLEPAAVWDLFARIAAVPRPSKKEEQVRQRVVELAAAAGRPATVDTAGNVLIGVPASPGREGAPTIVLQAHLDMVCEKNDDVVHDFDAEGIRLVAGTDDAGRAILRGDRTTLGADDGIGVALALAAATDPDLDHGPLQILLTVDEEDGMSGAKGIAAGDLDGRWLLNLDTEDDDTITVGCAGGCDSDLTWSLATEATDRTEAVRIEVEGLRGGHSGGDIHEDRANAIRLLAGLLSDGLDHELRLADLVGGNKRNAIPRQAWALVVGRPGIREHLARAAHDRTIAARARFDEPGLSIEIGREASTPPAAATADGTRRLVLALLALPCGVLEMQPDLPDAVRTSSNVSTVRASRASRIGEPLEVVVGNLSRSSCAAAVEATKESIVAVARLAGATVAHGNEYPGWESDRQAPLLAAAVDVYRSLHGDDPKIVAVHGGLEPGVLGQRVAGLECVSIGPNVRGAHSPDERVEIDSVGRSWRYLRALLTELAGRT